MLYSHTSPKEYHTCLSRQSWKALATRCGQRKIRSFDHILVGHRKAGEFQSEAGRGLCFCGVWLAFPWFSFHGDSLRGFWETWNLQHHPLVDSSPWRRTKIIDISINSFSLRPHSKRFFFVTQDFMFQMFVAFDLPNTFQINPSTIP